MREVRYGGDVTAVQASANLAYLGLFTISTMAQARMDAAPVEEKEIHCELE